MITLRVKMAAVTSILGIIVLSGCGKVVSQNETIYIPETTLISKTTTSTTMTTKEKLSIKTIILPRIKGQAIKEDLQKASRKTETTTTETINIDYVDTQLVDNQFDETPTTTTQLTETQTPISTEAQATTTTTTKTQTTGDYPYCEIPEGDTSFYAYMDWKAITNYNSPQYKLLSQGWTDSQGIRRVGDDVCIALGTYYTNTVGDRFLITTDKGNSYTAIVGDIKADCHTDSKNQFRWAGNNSKNVVEFIVDTYSLDYSVRTSGNIGTYDNYAGQITSIQKIN